MNKTIIDKIKAYFVNKPVIRAYLFGSSARSEDTPLSDIDILVELDYTNPIGLEFYRMRNDLEELLDKPVDLLSDNGTSKYIKPQIDKEKVLIYER